MMKDKGAVMKGRIEKMLVPHVKAVLRDHLMSEAEKKVEDILDGLGSKIRFDVAEVGGRLEVTIVDARPRLWRRLRFRATAAADAAWALVSDDTALDRKMRKLTRLALDAEVKEDRDALFARRDRIAQKMRGADRPA